jgi:hypothetical protein
MKPAFQSVDEYEHSVPEEAERVTPKGKRKKQEAREHEVDPREAIPPEDIADFGVEEPRGPDDPKGVRMEDFLAYMPMHAYIFIPTREPWPAASVNARVSSVIGPSGKPIAPTTWLDANAAIEQMTWAPGAPTLICDKLIAEGGWIPRGGIRVFNLYRPPIIRPGDAAQAGPWLDHARKVFNDDDAEHIVRWLAHRVQRPADKINHALVLGGMQGVGKDTLLEPVKRAVGPWNFVEISPQQMLGRFNGFLKSVILPHQRGARPRRVRPLRVLRPRQSRHRPPPQTCSASMRRTCASTMYRTSPA